MLRHPKAQKIKPSAPFVPTPGQYLVSDEPWQIQSAKARFSEVFSRARTQGPQLIKRQGKEGVVMINEEQYVQLVGKSHQPKNLVRFFRQSPLVGVELDFERDREPDRDIEL